MAISLDAGVLEPQRSRGWGAAAAVAFARRKPLGAAALVILLGLILIALFARAIAPYDPLSQNYDAVLQAPGAGHLMGTDNFGRDELSRVVYGARISLSVGVVAMLIGTVGGVVLGLLSGYFGGLLDLVLQRIIDAWIAFPVIIFALVILVSLGQGLLQAMIAIGIVGIPATSRVVRGTVMEKKESLYVGAARAMGGSHLRVMLVHILPNVMSTIIVLATLTLGRAILAEAILSFLGVGIPPPQPAWGSMLGGNARTYFLAAPWMAIWPGIFISLTVISWNLLGDALRDVLDPRLRGV
ncbi:MAG TPA: ABC transporter permease [Dehalococcoidia bacterium]|nr:ABC transporter permease [Dehalococcoidia bacterium]